MRFLNLILALSLTACASTRPKDVSANQPAELRVAEESGEKQYILYDPQNFYRPPGKVSSLSMMAFTARGKIREIPNSNALVIRVKKGEEPIVPKGMVIEEEHIYHTQHDGPDQLYKLVPASCPPTSPNPNPNPNPNPPPTPGTPKRVNTTWGQKAVGVAEASAIQGDAKAIKVCVIDTGLDRSVHSEFEDGVLVGGETMVQGEPWDQDPAKHGTHTAGTIASKKYGITAVKLYAIKVLGNNGSGMSSWIAGGINRCRAWGARIISASLGMDRGTDSTIGTAVKGFVTAGGIFIAAAGNSSGGPIGFPASMPEVIAVTSMDENGRTSSFSSRGEKQGEMVIAPGGGVLSLCPNGTCTMSGTSMAAPHAAGIMALALARGRTKIGVVPKGLPVTEQGRGLAHALESVK